MIIRNFVKMIKDTTVVHRSPDVSTFELAKTMVDESASNGNIKNVHAIIQGCIDDWKLTLIKTAVESFVSNEWVSLAKEITYDSAYEKYLLDLIPNLAFVFAVRNKLEQINEIICENQNEDYIDKIKLSAFNGYVHGNHIKRVENLLSRETNEQSLMYVCSHAIISIISAGKFHFLEMIEALFKDKPVLIDIHGDESNGFARYGHVEKCNALLAQYENDLIKLDHVLQRTMFGYVYANNCQAALALVDKYKDIRIPNSGALYRYVVAFLWKNGQKENKTVSTISSLFDRARDEDEKKLLYGALAYIAPQINRFDLVDFFLSVQIHGRDENILKKIMQGIALSSRLSRLDKQEKLLALNGAEDNRDIWYHAMQEFVLKHDMESMKFIFDSSHAAHHEYYLLEMSKTLLDQMKNMTEENLLKLIAKFNAHHMQGFKLLAYTKIIPIPAFIRFLKANKIQEIMNEFSWDVDKAFSAYTLWSIPLRARLGILRLSLHGVLPRNLQVLVLAYLLYSAEKANALYDVCLDKTSLRAHCTLFNKSLEREKSPIHRAVKIAEAIKPYEVIEGRVHEAEKRKEAKRLMM